MLLAIPVQANSPSSRVDSSHERRYHFEKPGEAVSSNFNANPSTDAPNLKR